MSQISQPVRILLIGAVVFLAAWFTLLRPKGETAVPPVTTSTTTTPAATSTPQTGLGKAVDAAKKAAGVKPEATATATPTTGTATTTTPETKPENAAITAVPKDVLAKLPKKVAGALTDRKVLVLGVLSEDAKSWRPQADDDRYVRNALKRTNRYEGDVVVKTVALDKLSTYGALVNDLHVTQSPSIVVIDRNLKGTVLTGYVDRVAINQSIADARRDSITPNITDTYLRKANSLCGHYETRVDRWSLPTVDGRKAEVKSLQRFKAILTAYGHRIAALDTPAKYKGLRTLWLKNERARRVAWDKVIKAHKTGTGYGKTNAAIASFGDVYSHKLNTRFNELGLTDCAVARTS
ncbi:hypothetical protein [Solirubrobacter soli]|uniref:hypothetical protein n=1 Tax=Solirubrobacter soli TaxID=363832 RepID=UPI0012F86E12|nr:hypothetical protein [Solirubrobacter soli]